MRIDRTGSVAGAAAVAGAPDADSASREGARWRWLSEERQLRARAGS